MGRRGQEGEERVSFTHMDLLSIRSDDVEFRVLLGDAIGSLLEGLDSRVRPPAPEDAMVVELASGGVEGVGELVGSNCSKSSILEVARPK
jgi:hypothetical protein